MKGNIVKLGDIEDNKKYMIKDEHGHEEILTGNDVWDYLGTLDGNEIMFEIYEWGEVE